MRTPSHAHQRPPATEFRPGPRNEARPRIPTCPSPNSRQSCWPGILALRGGSPAGRGHDGGRKSSQTKGHPRNFMENSGKSFLEIRSKSAWASHEDAQPRPPAPASDRVPPRRPRPGSTELGCNTRSDCELGCNAQSDGELGCNTQAVVSPCLKGGVQVILGLGVP